MTSHDSNSVADSKEYYDCVVETHIGYDDGLDWWQNQCCQFLKKLKLEFHDPDAWNLCCWAETSSSKKPCGCVQKFLLDSETNTFKTERVELLLKIYKDANEKKHLARITSNLNSSSGAIFSVNYAEYVNYVEKQRSLLKDYGLCENMLKKLLLYSNNFIYKAKNSLPKPLKSIRMKKNSPPVLDVSMVNNRCCDRNCFQVGLLKLGWLKQIQARSRKGQIERRQCIVEMLESPFYNFCQDFIAYICSCHVVTVINQRKNLPNRVRLKEKDSKCRQPKSLIELNNEEYFSIYESSKKPAFTMTSDVPVLPVICARKDSTCKENFFTDFGGLMEYDERMDLATPYGKNRDESYESNSNKFRYEMIANSTPLELFSSRATIRHSAGSYNSTTSSTAFKNKSSASNVLLSQDHQFLPQCNQNLTLLTSNNRTSRDLSSPCSANRQTPFMASNAVDSSHKQTTQDYFFIADSLDAGDTVARGSTSQAQHNTISKSNKRSFASKPVAKDVTNFCSYSSGSASAAAVSFLPRLCNNFSSVSTCPSPSFSSAVPLPSAATSRHTDGSSFASPRLSTDCLMDTLYIKDNLHAQDNEGNFHDYLFTTQDPFDYSTDIYTSTTSDAADTDYGAITSIQKQLECAEPNSSIEDEEHFSESPFPGLPDLSSDSSELLTESDNSSNSNSNCMFSLIPNDLVDTPNFHLSLGYFEDLDPLPPPNAQVSVSPTGEPIELILANGKITYLPSTVASILHS